MKSLLPPAAASLAALVAAAPGFSDDWPACGTVEVYPVTIEAGAGAPAGWDADALDAARARFEATDAAALVALHRGRVVAAWGDVDEPYLAQSVRKSLLNALVGDLVAEGRLSLEASLAGLAVDDEEPALRADKRAATVEDLLLSRSGIAHPALYEHGSWRELRAALAEDPSHDFGRGDWIYNNWDFNALGTIVEQAGGAPLGDQFETVVAAPTGMEDFRPRDVSYLRAEHLAARAIGDRSVHAAYMFSISTRDLARFGLLYLGCGGWDGEEVLPEAWVRASIEGRDTQEGFPFDFPTGFDRYGYLFSVDFARAARFPGLDALTPYYAATGARGHFMVVVPKIDLVIAAQPPTGGGMGLFSQMSRRFFGSPELTEAEFAEIVSLIAAAHPDTE